MPFIWTSSKQNLRQVCTMSRHVTSYVFSSRLYILTGIVCLLLLWGTIVLKTGSNMAGRPSSTLLTPRKFLSTNHSREGQGVSTGASDLHVPLKFDCTNIHQINIIHEHGGGPFKSGFMGVYEGRNVVLKMVTNTSYATTKLVG